MVVEHLADFLTDAEREAPGDAYIALQPITICRESRMCIFQHPDSKILFSNLKLGKHAKLKFGIGIKEVAWNQIKSAVEFKIIIRDQKGKSHEVFSESLDVRINYNRAFLDFEISLSKFDRQTISLQLLTSVPEGADNGHAWSGWSDPCLESEREASAPLIYKNRQQHVLFLTGDALRADHIACYGHPLVRTPNIDRLAKDGVLISHARTQSSTTLGSFASLLTGQQVFKHGISAEWGELDSSLPNIPAFLKAHGYHCLVAVGEREHEGHAKGLTQWFDEQLDCLGMPAQSGDVTSRRFIKWLDRRPDKPFFGWIQYFDTHPPAVLPREYVNLYYNGDPCSSLREFDTKKVAEIRGVESVLELELFLEALEHGQTNAYLCSRMEDSARMLSGEKDSGPDLAIILKELGPSARLGMDEAAFAKWLFDQSSQLRGGTVTSELKAWIRTAIKDFRIVEKEIIAWVDGVVDYRFPLSQYLSAVAFLDHQIGKIIAALEERKLYEQTTIVFTAPHGELLGEHGMYFHHLSLSEEVARVPLIIKPGLVDRKKSDFVIGGVMDLIDIFPTLMECLGLTAPTGIDGISRWDSIKTGSPIPEHDSFGMNQHNTFAVFARPPFVLIRALCDTYTSAEFRFLKGQSRLLKLQTPMSYEDDLSDKEPEIAALMGSRLDSWLKLHEPSLSLKS